jgi:hypothetical protein
VAFVLMLLIAAAAGLVYFFFAMSSVPGAREERFGKLEALPEDVGKWRVDADSRSGREAQSKGTIREVRYFYHEPQGFAGSGRLVLQVRYRDASTKKIALIEPERTVERRRVRS